MTRDVPWFRFLTGFLVLWPALYGLGRIGTTSIDHGVATAAVVLALAVVVESHVSKTAWANVPARLGLGRPGFRAMVAALIVSLIVLATLPAYAYFAGEHLQLADDVGRGQRLRLGGLATAVWLTRITRSMRMLSRPPEVHPGIG